MMPLTEGGIYSFIVAGEVILPNEISCYKLTDPNGVKHLLVKSDYENYGFVAGKTIQCRIDKVNCNGQIFIEPLHPIYKKGKCYDFIFEKEITAGISAKHQNSQALLNDKVGNKTLLPLSDLPEDLEPGEAISCEIDTIRKGMLYVRPCIFSEALKTLITDRVYSFKIINSKMYAGNREYYTLQDAMGQRYLLRKKFYQKYGFDVGDSIQCEVKDLGTDRFLEPVHPQYKKNETYDFKIIGEDTITKYPDFNAQVIYLRNPWGKSIVIERSNINAQNINGNKLRCLVLDVIKSTPALDCAHRTT